MAALFLKAITTLIFVFVFFSVPGLDLRVYFKKHPILTLSTALFGLTMTFLSVSSVVDKLYTVERDSVELGNNLSEFEREFQTGRGEARITQDRLSKLEKLTEDIISNKESLNTVNEDSKKYELKVVDYPVLDLDFNILESTTNLADVFLVNVAFTKNLPFLKSFAHRLNNQGKNLSIFQLRKNERDQYLLAYGFYNNEAEAVNIFESMTDKDKRYGAYVTTLADLKTAMSKQ